MSSVSQQKVSCCSV